MSRSFDSSPANINGIESDSNDDSEEASLTTTHVVKPPRTTSLAPHSTAISSKSAGLGIWNDIKNAFKRPDIPSLWEDPVASPIQKQPSGFNESQETVETRQPSDSNDMNAIEVQRLLNRIERENKALERDPRSVLVEAGGIKTTLETFQTLSDSISSRKPVGLATADGDSSDESFWKSLLEETKQLSTSRISHLLSSRTRRSGIPQTFRRQLWLKLSNANIKHAQLVYAPLSQDHSAFDTIIQRDINRTFPNVDMFMEFHGKGQQMLLNVLRAYSNYDSGLGYCQGLSFCAGIFLMQELTEEEAFALLVRLLEEPSKESYISDTISPTTNQQHSSHTAPIYALRSFFIPEMTGLHLALYQHTELVKKLVPSVGLHLDSCGVKATMYASQWFLTFFSYNFPIPIALRLFDLMLVEGAALTMVRFSVGILKVNETRLLDTDDLEELLGMLKGEMLVLGEWSVDELIVNSFSFADRILQSDLGDLEKTFINLQQEAASVLSKFELDNLNELVRKLKREQTSSQAQIQRLQLQVDALTRTNNDLREKLKSADENNLVLMKETQVMRARINQLEQIK